MNEKNVQELILMGSHEPNDKLLERPAQLAMMLLFYHPEETELSGETQRKMLRDVRKISWERRDYIQNPSEEVYQHMKKVCATGYINIKGVPSELVYAIKQPLANRGPSYLNILEKGIPGGISQIVLGEDGEYTLNPEYGDAFWFEGNLYQFVDPELKIHTE